MEAWWEGGREPATCPADASLQAPSCQQRVIGPKFHTIQGNDLRLGCQGYSRSLQFALTCVAATYPGYTYAKLISSSVAYFGVAQSNHSKPLAYTARLGNGARGRSGL